MKLLLLEVSLMNFILLRSNDVKRKVKVVLLVVLFMIFTLWISNDIKWKVKVVLLEVSLMNFFSDIKGDQMGGESIFTRSIVDELHS